ncbi:hypothetical protein [Rhodobacteraceae bacterium DSL-40]|uniref:hypothetical protein n=1 Tax=Amaricoccus sp. B4 TaxID=3368557 RepID=UPI0013A6A8A6
MQQVESDVPPEMLPALRHGLAPPIARIRRRTRQQIAAAICVIAMLQAASAVGARNERLGDSIQIALPVLGTACAVLRGDFGDYAARFAGNMAVVHGLKNGLGAAEINLRPGGSTRGFPSGHTAAAVHGASYLVRECGAFVPYAGPLLALGAGSSLPGAGCSAAIACSVRVSPELGMTRLRPAAGIRIGASPAITGRWQGFAAHEGTRARRDVQLRGPRTGHCPDDTELTRRRHEGVARGTQEKR